MICISHGDWCVAANRARGRRLAAGGRRGGGRGGAAGGGAGPGHPPAAGQGRRLGPAQAAPRLQHTLPIQGSRPKDHVRCKYYFIDYLKNRTL